MPIGLLLPKVFTLSREAFTVKDTNTYLEAEKSLIFLIFAVLMLVIGYLIHFMIKNKDIAYIIDIIGIISMAIGYSSASQQNNIDDQVRNSSNGFRIAQSSFQIRPNNRLTPSDPSIKTSINDDLVAYMLKDSDVPTKTTTNYRVYVTIHTENGKKQTYLIGKMVNGVLSASTKGSHNEKVIPHSMLNIMNCYASYIKKHHLEKEFADSATLRFSTKYLDKDYKPMLVMTNKNGKTLHLKQNGNINVKNVVSTN